MGQWNSAKADTYEDGLDRGREEIAEEVKDILDSWDNGDTDREETVSALRELVYRYA